MTTNTLGTTARRNAAQMVHYLRFAVNFNDVGIAAGVRKQTLPAGALIIGTDIHVGTAFNAATTNVLTVGSAAGANADIISGAAANEGATGLTQNIPPTGAMLGPIAADTPVFVQYTQTGAAATAGQATIVIKYIPNNDL
ncbi:hypothetical protein HU230_0011715 [Bradyrhizobium quebecense]|uniref:Uncharacterized protein n=1 Tax=Bradyrhizobium quebecense TaxID=2748629 RepID=A0A973WPB5_9BRAD|nr:hypothetical protein [Bradyrhizobium quebecense]UGA46661.1 hypothetical protein HU230_0011715 [Bradyrhizobium quebecense]